MEAIGLKFLNRTDSGFVDTQKSPKMLLIQSGNESPKNIQCLKTVVREIQLWIKMQISNRKAIKHETISGSFIGTWSI